MIERLILSIKLILRFLPMVPLRSEAFRVKSHPAAPWMVIGFLGPNTAQVHIDGCTMCPAKS